MKAGRLSGGSRGPGLPREVRSRHVWRPDLHGPDRSDRPWRSGPLPPGKGQVPPRAASAVVAGLALPRAHGARPFAGLQPNHHLECWLLGRARQSQKVWPATDTQGREADTTVSLPVSKVARRNTEYCAQAAYSPVAASRTRVMMACCRWAEVCAVTVHTEATAR
jgi:hypothetical protein